MALKPEDIMEEVIDDLGLGELAQRVTTFRLTRTGPGSVLLDYGESGRFRLSVVEEPE